MTEFGRLLKALRQQKGWTQEELAHAATLSVRSVRDLEAGRVARPRSRSVRLLYEALELTAEEITKLRAAASGPQPAAAATSGLSQLPLTVSDFIGRTAELAQLDEVLRSPDRPSSVVVWVIGGTAGVGKTALATHWARKVADQFPEGQLYIDMRGYDRHSAPLLPTDALGRLLRSLGVAPDTIPTDVEEQSSMFRGLLSSRRALLLIDNAASADQVRPLLPGQGVSTVVVTSRNRLDGLVARDGARPLEMRMLAPVEARELLGRMIGPTRAAAEPAAVDELARLCGYLPLALRIAAAKLAVEPGRRVADATASLSARDRLSALAIDDDADSSVRDVFDASYRALDPQARLMFRRLGLIPGADFGTSLAASLPSCSQDTARDLLHRLAGLNLVECLAVGRFRLHDLLKDFAAERISCDDSAADRSAAVTRMLAYYLSSADNANRALRPGRVRPDLAKPVADVLPDSFDDYDMALRWCEHELPNLAAAVDFAAEEGRDDYAWRLPVAMIDFFLTHKHWPEWIATHQIALEAVRRVHDRPAEGVVLRNLALARHDLRQFADAEMLYAQAIAIGRDDADPMPLARALGSLGILYMDLNRPLDAIPLFKETLEVANGLADRYGVAVALQNLGCAYGLADLHADAARTHRDALGLFRAVGDPYGEASALSDLGETLRKSGQLSESIEHLHTALALERKHSIQAVMMETYNQLALSLRESGDADAAREHWREALEVAQRLHSPRVAEFEELLADQIKLTTP